MKTDCSSLFLPPFPVSSRTKGMQTIPWSFQHWAVLGAHPSATSLPEFLPLLLLRGFGGTSSASCCSEPFLAAPLLQSEQFVTPRDLCPPWMHFEQNISALLLCWAAAQPFFLLPLLGLLVCDYSRFATESLKQLF